MVHQTTQHPTQVSASDKQIQGLVKLQQGLVKIPVDSVRLETHLVLKITLPQHLVRTILARQVQECLATPLVKIQPIKPKALDNPIPTLEELDSALEALKIHKLEECLVVFQAISLLVQGCSVLIPEQELELETDFPLVSRIIPTKEEVLILDLTQGLRILKQVACLGPHPLQAVECLVELQLEAGECLEEQQAVFLLAHPIKLQHLDLAQLLRAQEEQVECSECLGLSLPKEQLLEQINLLLRLG